MNSWNEVYFNLLFFLKQKLSMLYFRYLVLVTSCYFPEFRFLELFAMLLDFRLYKYFSFSLIRKPYPNFCQIFTMDCVIESPLAHILRVNEIKNSWRLNHIFISGYSNTLVVLKNSLYIKEQLVNTGSEYAEVLNI